PRRGHPGRSHLPPVPAASRRPRDHAGPRDGRGRPARPGGHPGGPGGRRRRDQPPLRRLGRRQRRRRAGGARVDPVRHRRLTLLLASPRVAPGLLSADAWDALRSAAHVVAADPTAPHPAAVAAAGVDVGPALPDASGAPPSPGALADLLLSLVARHGTVV